MPSPRPERSIGAPCEPWPALYGGSSTRAGSAVLPEYSMVVASLRAEHGAGDDTGQGAPDSSAAALAAAPAVSSARCDRALHSPTPHSGPGDQSTAVMILDQHCVPPCDPDMHFTDWSVAKRHLYQQAQRCIRGVLSNAGNDLSLLALFQQCAAVCAGTGAEAAIDTAQPFVDPYNSLPPAADLERAAADQSARSRPGAHVWPTREAERPEKRPKTKERPSPHLPLGPTPVVFIEVQARWRSTATRF
jgi:hypothetical protein